MELFIFARFHVRKDAEDAAVHVLRRQIGTVRSEPGCLAIDAFRSTRDPQLFWIHSRWQDEAAFEIHAALAATTRFLERMGQLADQPIDIARTHSLTR